MRHASGRYLCFVDGDDFIDAAFLKHLLDASDRGASDLTVAGKLFCDRFPPDKIPALPTCGIFLRREFPLKNNLEFPEGIHPCEDGLFSHFVLALTEKFPSVRRPFTITASMNRATTTRYGKEPPTSCP